MKRKQRFIDSYVVNQDKLIDKKKIYPRDASSILGVNEYKGIMSLYKEIAEYDYYEAELDVTYQMELGSKLKDFVANEFSIRTDKKVRNINGLLVNDKYPFSVGKVDKAIVSEKAFLECIVTNSFVKNAWNTIPPMYEVKCHHNMAISGATHCYIAVLIGNEKLIIHELKRDEGMINNIMKAEKMFYDECIINKKEPLPDGDIEYSSYLKEKYKNSKDDSLILFIEDDKLKRYDELVDNIKSLQREKTSIEQYIQNEMKEYETAYLHDRKITWKNISKNILDTKLIKKEHPELVSKFMKTTTSRVFKIN